MGTIIKLEKDDVYGNFTFIEYSKERLSGKVCGLWICNICNNPCIKENTRIVNLKYKSCGCIAPCNKEKLKQHDNPDYCWIILLNRIKKRCKSTKERKIVDCNITPEYLKFIYEKQDGRCFYTGYNIHPAKKYTKLEESNIISVDRIDSNLGYIEGNIQFTTKNINMMKQLLSHDDFIKICKSIANIHPL